MQTDTINSMLLMFFISIVFFDFSLYFLILFHYFPLIIISFFKIIFDIHSVLILCLTRMSCTAFIYTAKIKLWAADLCVGLLMQLHQRSGVVATPGHVLVSAYCSHTVST